MKKPAGFMLGTVNPIFHLTLAASRSVKPTVLDFRL